MTLFRRVARVLAILLAALLGSYLLVAYILLPEGWNHYEHHPSLATFPKVTTNADGIPGDPLNVGLMGTREEVMAAFAAAGWQQAARLGLRSDLAIAESVVLDHPDPNAPVSNLYLWGRPEDLAFEQVVGTSARERQHVRFWRADEASRDGRPLWIGAASFDQSVGFSHLTGQITHHIASDLDAERDRLMADLAAARQLQIMYQVTGVGPTLNGRNAEGDRYFTDGEVTIGVLVKDNVPLTQPVVQLPNPTAVNLKNQFWSWLHPLLNEQQNPQVEVTKKP
jgi:hypothetical protein